MKVEYKMSLGASFQLEKFTADGTITYQGPVFENTILDCGLFSLYTQTFKAMMTYVNIGSSNAAVDVTQTGLLDRKFSTNSTFVGNTGEASSTPGKIFYGFYKVFQFAIGSCTGTFAEIGLSLANNATYLNRQLIKDNNGNPINLTVSATEGLRIKVYFRIYADTSIVPYSEIYTLDTKGATAGSIVFGNGVTTKAVTLASLKTDPTAARDVIEDMTGGYTIAFVDNDLDNPNLIRFLTFPRNAASLNLTMNSNTLTGGTEAATFVVTQPFNLSNFPDYTVNLEDVTAASNTSLTYKKYLLFPSYYQVIRYFGQVSNSSYALFDYSIGTLYLIALIGSTYITPSSTTKTKVATLGDPNFEVKVYYAPGVLSGSDTTLQYLRFGSNSFPGACYEIRMNAPIPILNTENFEYTVSISWGRKT